MVNARHNIANDFIIQNIGDIKGQYFTADLRYAAGGSLPCEKSVLFAAQAGEIIVFDALTSQNSSESPFSFWSGTQDTAFSVSFWIYITAAPGSPLGVCVSKGLFSGTTQREWMVFLSTANKINIQLVDESTDGKIGKYTDDALSTSAWHHVVTTYSGNETSNGCKIYIDGSAVDITTSESGTYNGMDTSVAAGGYYGFIGGVTLKANMTETSIWNTELTAAEITSLYNSGTPTNLLQETVYKKDFSNLVAWWRMGNHHADAIKAGGHGGTGVTSVDNIINDISGNSRHGLPSTGWDGDEITTTHPKSVRPGNVADNPDALSNPELAPLNLVNRGAPNLRKRNNPYKVTKG